jgi:hypothetical protein
MDAESGPVRVSFGPGNTQDMPIEWAEHMLTEWARTHPPQFGKALTEAALNAK